ncbi:MAG: hypothetical protein AAED33_14850 [Paracoccaceae bacterium]
MNTGIKLRDGVEQIPQQYSAHHYAPDFKYGLQTKCEGGGIANATIIEAL